MKEYCRLCDSTYEPNDAVLNAKCKESWAPFLKILDTCMPKIILGPEHSVCKSCFDYVMNFSMNKVKWLKTEYLVKVKKKEGRFNGLKDIVDKLKRESSHICRLCLKETDIQEVVFIYLDDQVYNKGYIREILKTHSPQTELNITENPIICQECLDTIQTYDAFYQMCLEVQSVHNDKCQKITIVNDDDSKEEEKDHFQLQKTVQNTEIFRQLTEAESAIGYLEAMSGKKDNDEEPDKVIINGLTTQKFLSVETESSKLNNNNNNNQKNEDDVFVISSDDEDLEETLVDVECDKSPLRNDIAKKNLQDEDQTSASLEFIDASSEISDNEVKDFDIFRENDTTVSIENEESNAESPAIRINMSEIFKNDDSDTATAEKTGNVVSPNLEIIELSDDSDTEAAKLAPSFAIDMSKLSALFNDKDAEQLLQSQRCKEKRTKTKTKKKKNPPIEINMSEMFGDKRNNGDLIEVDNSNLNELEMEMSDFLKFKKILEEPDELEDFDSKAGSSDERKRASIDDVKSGSLTESRRLIKRPKGATQSGADAFGNLKIEYFSLEKASFTDAFARFVESEKRHVYQAENAVVENSLEEYIQCDD